LAKYLNILGLGRVSKQISMLDQLSDHDDDNRLRIDNAKQTEKLCLSVVRTTSTGHSQQCLNPCYEAISDRFHFGASGQEWQDYMDGLVNYRTATG